RGHLEVIGGCRRLAYLRSHPPLGAEHTDPDHHAPSLTAAAAAGDSGGDDGLERFPVVKRAHPRERLGPRKHGGGNLAHFVVGYPADRCEYLIDWLEPRGEQLGLAQP